MLANPNIYDRAYLEGLKPDPLLSVSEWADKHRVLTQVSSAEPGIWRTDRTPYLREIMNCLSVESPIQEVVFMKGAQVGGTECGNNWLGYVVDHAPGPIMLVMPRVDDAKKNSKIRLEPMIEASERLKGKIKERKSRESGNTILQKDFPGGTMVLTGANSGAGLRSVPCRYVFFDEVDAYPGDVEGEGDPINLGKKRASTFSKKKFFLVSTPTIEGRSRISFAYEQTDQRRYFVPCPECGFMQWLKWDRVKWDKGHPETAGYECEGCNFKIKNWQKTKMLEKGEWRATAECGNKKVAGFHLSALYAPVGWLSWEDLAREWEEVTRDKNTEKLKTFINTALGETWKDKGDAPDWKRLFERREQYKINTLPDGVCLITAGADVQKDRIEVEIVGWGRNKRSWSVDYRVFPGDTSALSNEPWQRLTALLGEVWQTTGGQDLEIRTLAVDTGYNTQVVYSWARQFPITKVMAVKGQDNQTVLVGQPNAVDVTVHGRKVRRGLKLFPIGVGLIKSELYGWLRLDAPTDDEPEPFGFCHFPEYDEEYFKQLSAEQLVVKFIKGFKRYEWEKTRERNEALDCRVYARAAASLNGVDRFTDEHWARLESEAGLNSKQGARESAQVNVGNVPSFRRKVKIVRRKSQ